MSKFYISVHLEGLGVKIAKDIGLSTFILSFHAERRIVNGGHFCIRLTAQCTCSRLGLRVEADEYELYGCRCVRRMNARGGLHRLSFKFSAGRYPRHADLNNIITHGLQSVGMPSTLELVRIDKGSDRRPDDITVFLFSNVRSLCWDASCPETYAEMDIAVRQYY